MPTVNQILGAKGNDVWSIGPGEPVLGGLRTHGRERRWGIAGAARGRSCGNSLRARLSRKIALKGKRSTSTLVSEIMTKKAISVQPNDLIRDCMELMTSKRIRHLPVMDGAQVLGIISIGDVVREIISDHEMKIEQLENYIKGY